MVCHRPTVSVIMNLQDEYMCVSVRVCVGAYACAHVCVSMYMLRVCMHMHAR